MRYVITRRAEIDRLEHRIRQLELEAARHEWLKASHRALERSHDAALSWIRSHRCSPVALPASAAVPSFEEADRGTD